jgi:MoxR-like ATPase
MTLASLLAPKSKPTQVMHIDPLLVQLNKAVGAVNQMILGKPQQIRLAFACVLAGGHLLLEDIPGTGKTILARSLAATLDLDFKRVQFTSDLMPSDVLGVSIYNPKSGTFELHQGPVFTNILLADEINRAPPRSQSALLEAMAEGQVSIDKTTYKLPPPFLVIATQNPIDLAGTFPLPAAQKDRFLFQLSMGYPGRDHELALMRGQRRSDMLENPGQAALDADALLALRARTRLVRIEETLLSYAYDLVTATRNNEDLEQGLSPRASLDLVAASQALALLSGRDYVTPEDIQEAFAPLSIHRIHARHERHGEEANLITSLLRSVPAP